MQVQSRRPLLSKWDLSHAECSAVCYSPFLPFFFFLDTLEQIIYKSQAFVFNLLKCHSMTVTYISINI